jgi:hypothetical protein
MSRLLQRMARLVDCSDGATCCNLLRGPADELNRRARHSLWRTLKVLAAGEMAQLRQKFCVRTTPADHKAFTKSSGLAKLLSDQWVILLYKLVMGGLCTTT